MIYIAEHEGYENNEHKLEITGKTVSREEYDDFMANFKFYGQYHQFKEIHEICLESNLDLMNFLSVKNLNNILRTRNVNHEKILQTGNKLLLRAEYRNAFKRTSEIQNDWNELLEELRVYLSSLEVV